MTVATASQITITEYQLTRQIPSVFLEKDTVALIEAFMLERGLQVDPPRARGRALFVSIVDSTGAYRLPSIKDYPPHPFDEGTESLFVSYGEFEKGLSITVSFSAKAAESHVSVYYRGVAARKVAESLIDGIVNILAEVKTGNALYHPGLALRGALTALLLVAVGLQLGFFIAYRKVFELLLPLTLVLYSYMYLAPMFNPYTIFDTPRGRRALHWSTWLAAAGLALLLFWFADSLIRLLFP